MSGVPGWRGGWAALVSVLAFSWTVAAGEDAPGAIRAALAHWTEQFNAGRAVGICDLFAPELRYDFAGFPERGYGDLCALLHRSLADGTKRYSYALDVAEIIPSGDLAVVRLTWTLTVRDRAGKVLATTREPAMDIFRRQSDGRWRIIRYLAYETPGG